MSYFVRFLRFPDKIYAQTATNDELYSNEVQPIVEQVINGYNCTIFAYGQTSSGKTYTMLGTKQNPGMYISHIVNAI